MNHNSKRHIILLSCLALLVLWWYKDTLMHLTYAADHVLMPEFTNENNNLADDVTIVTAFFNIGTFAKMKGKRKASSFLAWMKKYSRVINPVVAYIDNKKDLNYFLDQRKYMAKNLTKAFLVNRDELWAFRLLPRIQNVLNKLPPAPHGFPHVRNHLYSAIMHAKYELIERSIMANYFKTKYISWVDMGFFRTMLSDYGDPVKMALPPALSRNKVAYSEVVPFDNTLTARRVFVEHPFWLCGNYFAGTLNTMYQWALEYKRCAMKFLSQDLTGTDQMVLHAMFLETGCNLTRSEKLELYHPPLGLGDRWHAAGRLAWHEWKRLQRKKAILDICFKRTGKELDIRSCINLLEGEAIQDNPHLFESQIHTTEIMKLL